MEPLVVIMVIPDVANAPDTFKFVPPPVMRTGLKLNNAPFHVILHQFYSFFCYCPEPPGAGWVVGAMLCFIPVVKPEHPIQVEQAILYPL